MASEDNVVRLKHLQALAQTVANEIADITLQGGGSAANLPYNADFALYVPNDTSIIVTGKQQPVLSLGSWRVADSIYSAAITYNGDGTISSDIGTISNGFLNVADNNGIFNGVISASAGNDFAASKLAFSYNNVSGQGGSIPNSIITALGSQFVPTVDNTSDFLDYSDANIQFFDNRLKQFFDAKNDYLLLLDDRINAVTLCPTNTDQLEFLNGQTTISTGINGSAHYIISSTTNNSITIASNTTISSYDLKLFKLDENAGFVVCSKDKTNGSYVYQGMTSLCPFTVDSNGSIAAGTKASLTVDSNSVASAEHKKTIEFAHSCLSPHTFFRYIAPVSKSSLGAFSHVSFQVDGLGKGMDTLSFTTEIATIYPDPNGKSNNLDDYGFAKQYPAVIQFDGQDVTVSKAETTTTSPFLHYKIRARNSSGSITGGADYVAICPGYSKGSVKTGKLTTIQSGAESTLSPWLEDDGEFIHGTYPNKDRTDCYVVTYKPGTYPKSSWLNDAFSVWNVDFLTPRFIKTSKHLPDILDDLVL